MKEPVLLKNNKNNSLKIKNELEDIYGKVIVYDIDQESHAERHDLEDPGIFVCRIETDTDNIVEDAMRIAADNRSPILFILSSPEKCSYDRIASMEMVCYIKEPYTRNELKYSLKKAASSAKICEWNYQLLNDSIKDVLFSMGPTGKILYVSPSIEKLSGFTQEDVFNRDLKELVTEDTFTFISGLIGTFCSKLKTGEAVRPPVFDMEIIHKDGSTLWVELTINPVFDEDKNFRYFTGTMHDITEKKEVENELKERDEMFRLIAENANDVIWVLGTNGEVLYVSPSLKKLRGYTPEEIKHETMEERFTPESAKLVKETWASFFMRFRKGVIPDIPQKMEVEQPCKDGSTVWTELHINPVLNDEGNLKFFLGISRDISERRERAKELERQSQILDGIFDLAPIPIILLDGNGIIEKMNQACMRIQNINPETAIGKKAGEVFSCSNASYGDGCGANDECISCLFRNMELETLATKKNIYKREGIYTLQRPDGSQVKLHMQASTAYTNTLDSEKVIMSFENITQRKKAEEEIVRSKMEAEEASRTKSEFLATMSHELRTPLNAIIGYSQMLQEENFGSLTTKQQKFAKHVHTSGKHLLDLINDILDLSKVEAGKMELHYERFSVNHVMKNVYNIIAPLADKKEIDIDFLISEDINIYADKVRFKQILYNLMSNAIKFTHDNGNVYIKAETDNGTLKVSVADTGIGMSEKEQERLFTPFYQADSSTARKYQGTGLGLSIVKKMIELHDGTIEVESEAGKGSTFTFTLPVGRMN
ncbi:PAS domain S-box protein [Methanolobus sp. WCC4]|uniref:sensor histidine kinase n=1 Tax=Methanolobus sp. WCC4 TaxID=3125784 RepID=UPI0030F97129